jgi:hypothetical protein
MTAQLLNRDVFDLDPSANSLQNDGVSKVNNTAALRYELSTFVCEGEYEKGLFRILDTYLSHLSQTTQPSAWVSGFYGSGKSHLVKILEALWSNDPLPDGQKPRDIARLPGDIREQFLQLSNEAKRAGGLWSASGMLSESGNQSVRMLILGIVYKAAGLSSNYGRARFRLWVRERGWENEIVHRITAQGREPQEEFDQYLVSPEIAEAVWELSGSKSTNAESAQESWHAQFNRDDISIDEMESALRQVLKLQSSDGKSVPLTLIVLDEVQQYIDDRGSYAQALQEAVERIQTAFDSKVLVVATGQAALNTTANLQKLQGRFTVNVMLSDKDVEHVVREVVLRKDPTQMPNVEATVRGVEGEIDRHLQSTKIGPRSEDKAILVADYPLLPTRNRFWANLLHQLDPTGTSGQLRTQLRVVHGATVHVADKPLGHVIPADFIYDQLHTGLLQSGALPRDVSNIINDQDDGTEDGKLRARLIQLIFLIERLPSGDINDAGIKATVENLADLLVEDLKLGSDDLRRRIPGLLKGLEDDGKLMRSSDGSYAIQTGESLKWTQQLQQQYQSLISNAGPLGDLRTRAIENLIREQLKTIRKTHGRTNTARDLTFRFGNDAPEVSAADSSVIVWVRDGWNSSDKTVKADARSAGDESSIIYVYVPQRNQQDVQTALANYEAAKLTLDMRGASQDTLEGQQAADSVRNRMQDNERRYTALLREVVSDAEVFQGGGAQVDGSSLREKIQTAFDSSLKRLFPSFSEGDHLGWDKVFARASDGNADALKAVEHIGDDADHAVVREIRKQIPGGAGVSWSAIRKSFENAPYGWPRDAVDGSVAVLVNTGAVNAMRNGKEVRGKDLVKQQANAIQLIGEDVFPTKMELLAARRPFVALDGTQPSDENVRAQVRELVVRLSELVKKAGGEPPLPISMAPPYLTELQNQTGNLLIKSIAVHSVQIEADIKTWRARIEEIGKRLETWTKLERMAKHAERLEGFAPIQAKLQAIRDNRQLLAKPDPVAPVASELGEMLRTSLRRKIERYDDQLAAGLGELKASNEWMRLNEIQQEGILAKPTLRNVPLPSLSSDRDLLNALDSRSLSEWDTNIEAVPTRLNAVRGEAIRLLQPTVQDVTLERRLFEKPRDVDVWIAETRQAILRHLNEGHPVQIK